MEIASESRYVRKVVALGERPSDRIDMLDPGWEQIEQVLLELAAGKYLRIDLFNGDESSALTIYGDNGAFFIVISQGESTYHYFWNGKEATGELRKIAGHAFDAEKVCEDFETVVQITREFWQFGSRVKTVKWISETLET